MDGTGYQKVASHEARKGDVKRCVLLYSGGLDTSVMLKWLQDNYGVEVIALTCDIGQQADNLDEVRAKAVKLGAVEAVVADLKEEYVSQYVAPGIHANASYMGDYHLSTPIGRPLLALEAVRTARRFAADCIAHGCTGKGNDQIRIETSILCHEPGMKIIAPVREWSMGRDQLLAYAAEHSIPVKQTRSMPYSWDDNVWGVTGEGGEIEFPSETPRLEDILQVTTLPKNSPNTVETLKIGFEAGLPMSVDGQRLPLLKVIQILNEAGGRHGVGYTHLIEDRVIGMKVRGIYENPGAHIIITAHKKLEQLVCTKDENRLKEELDIYWARYCYEGKWLDPVMEHLNGFMASVNGKVSGIVTVTLYKGKLDVVSIETPHSLIDPEVATFDRNLAFNQNASASFIEHFSHGMRMFRKKHPLK